MAEFVFTFIFTLELIINIFAHWFRKFFRDKWNVFDCLVVGLCLVSSGAARGGGRGGLWFVACTGRREVEPEGPVCCVTRLLAEEVGGQRGGSRRARQRWQCVNSH